MVLDFAPTSLPLPELVLLTGTAIWQEERGTAYTNGSFLLISSASERSSLCPPRELGSSKCRSFVEPRNHPSKLTSSFGKFEQFCIVSGSVQAAPLPPVLRCSLQLKTLPPWPLETCSHSKLPKWSCQKICCRYGRIWRVVGTWGHPPQEGLVCMASPARMLLHGNGLFVAFGCLLKETRTLQCGTKTTRDQVSLLGNDLIP